MAVYNIGGLYTVSLIKIWTGIYYVHASVLVDPCNVLFLGIISLAHGGSHYCPNANEVTMKNIGTINNCLNTKGTTVCIILGTRCNSTIPRHKRRLSKLTFSPSRTDLYIPFNPLGCFKEIIKLSATTGFKVWKEIWALQTRGGTLTHVPLMPHICVNQLGQHWFR